MAFVEKDKVVDFLNNLGECKKFEYNNGDVPRGEGFGAGHEGGDNDVGGENISHVEFLWDFSFDPEKFKLGTNRKTI